MSTANAANQFDKPEESILHFFNYSHLPPLLQEISKPFAILALNLCLWTAPGPERTNALRKLLESKDSAVRARLYPGK